MNQLNFCIITFYLNPRHRFTGDTSTAEELYRRAAKTMAEHEIPRLAGDASEANVRVGAVDWGAQALGLGPGQGFGEMNAFPQQPTLIACASMMLRPAIIMWLLIRSALRLHLLEHSLKRHCSRRMKMG
jgi:hypothetical protein